MYFSEPTAIVDLYSLQPRRLRLRNKGQKSSRLGNTFGNILWEYRDGEWSITRKCLLGIGIMKGVHRTGSDYDQYWVLVSEMLNNWTALLKC